MTVSIDIETRCALDLKDVGVYKYVEHETFAILCIAIKVGDTPTVVYDTTNGVPSHVKELIVKADEKWAFNAQFERICLNKVIGDTGKWYCTMTLAVYNGLPMSLDKVATELGVEDKDKRGKDLIRKFSVPNRQGGFNAPIGADFEAFMEYCKQDVEVEYQIRNAVRPMPVQEWSDYWLDQTINDRGVPVDVRFVNNAILIGDRANATDLERLKRLTGLPNPKSQQQLKQWLNDKGIAVDDTRKKTLKDVKATVPADIQEVLEIKERLGKTSLSKYVRMQECVMSDGRIRGLLLYYGASRTGRWAGRLVQVQNLPQNHLDNILEVRELVVQDMLDVYTDKVQDTLSQLIRTGFVGSFAVCDFSAIEARVIAWLAGEQWRMEVFATHGKIYEASASQMFNIPIEQCGKGTEWRQKGKVAELACGYGGGINALKQMGAAGYTDDELQAMIDAWRKANKQIVALWKSVENMVRKCLTSTDTAVCDLPYTKLFAKKIDGTLYVKLPSGRYLAYRALQTIAKYGRMNIAYMGTNQTTGKREIVTTYGGKLVENIVQAIARDCLMTTLQRCEQDGIETVMHVHDEIVALGDKETLERMEKIFAERIEWCADLILKGDGFVTPYYMKD